MFSMHISHRKRQKWLWNAISDTHMNVRLSRWYSPLPPITPTSTKPPPLSLIDDKSALKLPCSSVFEVIASMRCVNGQDKIYRELSQQTLSGPPSFKCSSTPIVLAKVCSACISSHMASNFARIYRFICCSSHYLHRWSQRFRCCLKTLNRKTLDMPELSSTNRR